MENPLDLIIIQKTVTEATEQVDLRKSDHKYYFEQLFEAFTPANISVVSLEKYESRGTCSSIAHVTFTDEDDAVRAFKVLNDARISKNENHQMTLTSQCRTLIDELPNEILIKILSELPIQDKLTIEEVCSRWEGIASTCWENQKKFYESTVNPRMGNEEFIQYLIRCGRYCEDIQISSDTPHKISSILEHCKNLSSVGIESSKCMYDAEWNLVLRLFAIFNVTRIMIKNSPDDRQFVQLHSFLEQLSEQTTEINLTGVRLYDTDPLRTSKNFDCSKFQNLRAFTLDCDELPPEFDFSGFQQLENLVCLSLKIELFDFELIETFANFTKLEHFRLSYSDLTDDILISILENNKNLEFLDISESYAITDRSLKLLEQHEKLRVLNITSCNGIRFEEICVFPNLRVLYSDYPFISHSPGWIKVIENSENLKVLVVNRRFRRIYKDNQEYCDYFYENEYYKVDCALNSRIMEISKRTQKVDGFTFPSNRGWIYLWIEDDSLRRKLGTLSNMDDSLLQSWIFDSNSWYTHENIRLLD